MLEQFWDGMGSYLDFTNPQAIRWWQERFRRQVLDPGFTAGWISWFASSVAGTSPATMRQNRQSVEVAIASG